MSTDTKVTCQHCDGENTYQSEHHAHLQINEYTCRECGEKTWGVAK